MWRKVPVLTGLWCLWGKAWSLGLSFSLQATSHSVQAGPMQTGVWGDTVPLHVIACPAHRGPHDEAQSEGMMEGRPAELDYV